MSYGVSLIYPSLYQSHTSTYAISTLISAVTKLKSPNSRRAAGSVMCEMRDMKRFMQSSVLRITVGTNRLASGSSASPTGSGKRQVRQVG
jgi:hypothetical protein